MPGRMPWLAWTRFEEGKHDRMRQQLVCANCKIVIRWQATIVDGQSYCCPGCAKGGPCECDYDNLPRSGEHSPIVLQADRLQRGDGHV